MTCRNRSADIVAVVCAVACEGGDNTVNPVEQRADRPGIIGIVTRQFRRDDPAGVGVRGEV